VKKVTILAEVKTDICKGCKVCEKVCPVHAIEAGEKTDWIAVVDSERCMGCSNCEQRCPHKAIIMLKREIPFTVGAEVDESNREAAWNLCKKARLNPEQVLCYCVGTRAEEAAAAIIGGARTPEEVSLKTGMRTGCTIECIQPLLRLLTASGNVPQPDKSGWQWYGQTVTAWEVSEKVKEKYNSRGFFFEEDRELMERIVEIEPRGNYCRGGEHK